MAIDFAVLRAFQDVLISQTAWVLGELDAFPRDVGESYAATEAKALTLVLESTGRAFLDEQFLALKAALIEGRGRDCSVDAVTRALVTRSRFIRNGLHAAVARIAAFIDGLGEAAEERHLGMLLRQGMIGGWLMAIDGIATELRSENCAEAGRPPEGEDFGVFDPATD